MRTFTVWCLVWVCCAADAHHSRSPFLLDETIQLEGVITEVSWRSPHVYFQIETSTESGEGATWTLEGHSIPGFLRLGWRQDSIEVGDRVVVLAHPNRVREKTFAMLYSATLPEGTTYYAYAIPEGRTVPGAPNRAATAPSTDFSGTWRHVIPVLEAAVGSFRPPSEWPLTARGRSQVEQFDLNADPALDCVPMGVPRLILATYSHRWIRTEAAIRILKERSPQVRIIHLDRTEPPQGAEPSELGYSIGRIEPDGTLVVTTTGFSFTPWGNSRGLDSSDRKRVIERYSLTNDGYSMDVSYTIDDPVYLSEPVTVTGTYQKSADFEFVEETCDPIVARRHLQY